MLLFLAKKPATRVVSAQPMSCSSLHFGVGVPISETQKLEVSVPVGNNFTTVFVPTDSDSLGFALLVRDESGWHSNDKDQLVARQASDSQKVTIDLSPNLRIIKGSRRLVVVRVPINSFSEMTVRPVVSSKTSVAGGVNNYEVAIAANGIESPFQALDRPLSPRQALEPQLSQILDQTQAGDLMVPDRFASEMHIEQIKGADLNLCPPSQ
jgi:hypothetical protein